MSPQESDDLDYNQLSWFTVVNPYNEAETKVEFKIENNGGEIGKNNIVIYVGHEKLLISPTQMTELGALFIALGGGKVDSDDVGELLSGYDMGLKVCPIRKTIS